MSDVKSVIESGRVCARNRVRLYQNKGGDLFGEDHAPIATGAHDWEKTCLWTAFGHTAWI